MAVCEAGGMFPSCGWNYRKIQRTLRRRGQRVGQQVLVQTKRPHIRGEHFADQRLEPDVV
jgi:rRNA pseudouridine-1189 N-methylase Emg1 (Nep1/Mra1 family)